MKLVGYARVSSDSQEENSSLELQQEKIQAYCTAMGHELVYLFVEVGSGKDTENREQFQNAIAALADVDGLIAAKLDRIARNTVDVLNLVDKHLKPQNKALVLLDLNVDTSTPTGRMILTTMSAVAELERNTINDRTRSGKQAKKKQGGYIHGAPQFGKQAKDKQLVDNESEQQVIEIIRRHHKSGKSLRQIADYLNKQGYKSKRGGEWKHTSVNTVLKRLYQK